MSKLIEIGTNRPAEILLVEDSEDDVFITRRAFERGRVLVNLHHVENGVDCMSFLRREGRFADAPRPDLVLLDLNLPVMDGREVLKEVVDDDALQATPIVVLTTSTAEQDLLEMYSLRCSSYIVKPVDFSQFRRVIEELTSYWFAVVVLPTDHDDDERDEVDRPTAGSPSPMT